MKSSGYLYVNVSIPDRVVRQPSFLDDAVFCLLNRFELEIYVFLAPTAEGLKNRRENPTTYGI